MKNKIVAIRKKPIKLTEALSLLLADTYVLYLKTQNFHWNVIGPNFISLHKMFEEQYTALAAALDEIAERIRALRSRAPATFAEYLKLATLSEAHGYPDADKMVLELLHGHEHLAKNINEAFEIAKEHNDEVTLDLFIARKNYHEKTAWMLRSTSGRS
jgi:starvation-inducible DNA-binding protein